MFATSNLGSCSLETFYSTISEVTKKLKLTSPSSPGSNVPARSAELRVPYNPAAGTQGLVLGLSGGMCQDLCEGDERTGGSPQDAH